MDLTMPADPLPKPTRIAKVHGHWVVEYEWHPGNWTALSMPLTSPLSALRAEILLTSIGALGAPTR